jgi:hypothetical protein
MIGGVLAIGDFMLMLLVAAAWTGAALLAAGLAGLSAVGGLAWAARHWWRGR